MRHSRDILHKEDHLDRVHSDQKVLKIIRQGRLVFVIGSQESQTSLRDHEAQVNSDQMVLVMARGEVGLCENESWKTSLAARNLTKTGRVTAQIRVDLLYLMGLMKGELLLMKMMMSENQSS